MEFIGTPHKKIGFGRLRYELIPKPAILWDAGLSVAFFDEEVCSIHADLNPEISSSGLGYRV